MEMIPTVDCVDSMETITPTVEYQCLSMDIMIPSTHCHGRLTINDLRKDILAGHE